MVACWTYAKNTGNQSVYSLKNLYLYFYLNQLTCSKKNSADCTINGSSTYLLAMDLESPSNASNQTRSPSNCNYDKHSPINQCSSGPYINLPLIEKDKVISALKTTTATASPECCVQQSANRNQQTAFMSWFRALRGGSTILEYLTHLAVLLLSRRLFSKANSSDTDCSCRP